MQGWLIWIAIKKRKTENLVIKDVSIIGPFVSTTFPVFMFLLTNERLIWRNGRRLEASTWRRRRKRPHWYTHIHTHTDTPKTWCHQTGVKCMQLSCAVFNRYCTISKHATNFANIAPKQLNSDAEFAFLYFKTHSRFIAILERLLIDFSMALFRVVSRTFSILSKLFKALEEWIHQQRNIGPVWLSNNVQLIYLRNNQKKKKEKKRMLIFKLSRYSLLSLTLI